MSVIENQLEHKQFHPYMAVYFYSNSQGDNYVQRHDVQDGKLRAGNPLKKESLTKLAEAVLSKDERFAKTKREILNPNILYAEGLDLLVWKCNASTSKLFFTDKLNIKSGVAYRLPTLIFVLKNRRDLSVYVTATDNVDMDTPIYYPPFLNILSGQKVCLGNARLAKEDKNSINGLIRTFNDLFFKSSFSEIHNGAEVKDNMILFWNSLEATKCKSFPYDKLVPLNKETVGSLLIEL